jgi:hypothetical protein
MFSFMFKPISVFLYQPGYDSVASWAVYQHDFLVVQSIAAAHFINCSTDGIVGGEKQGRLVSFEPRRIAEVVLADHCNLISAASGRGYGKTGPE